MNDLDISFEKIETGGDDDSWRQMLIDHYERLSANSRCSRFLSPTSVESVRRFVEGAMPEEIIFLHIDGQVRGVAEIHPDGEDVEVALSIEDEFQGRGYGRLLMSIAFQEAYGHGHPHAHLFYAASTRAMGHILMRFPSKMKSFGMEVLADVDLAPVAAKLLLDSQPAANIPAAS